MYHHYEHWRKEEIPIQQRHHTEQWCWEWGVTIMWGGGTRHYGKNLSQVRAKSALCLTECRGCTWDMQATLKNMHEWITFSDCCIPDIPSCTFPVSKKLSALWHHEGFRYAFHIVPPVLTIPPIFGRERKGIPDDDSKPSAAKGNSLHICFYAANVCMCVSPMSSSMCTLPPEAEDGVSIWSKFKMATCL